MKHLEYRERKYRELTRLNGLTYFSVLEKESDLFIGACRDLSEEALISLRRHRGFIENYIEQHESFLHSFSPVPPDPLAPLIVREMMKAAQTARVGPMASVAGAIAEFVGRDLLKYSDEIIVENGGDIYVNTKRSIDVGVFAGTSPLSQKVIVHLEPQDMPLGICTSSGTVGPSVSFGSADAVCVMARSAALADAAASAVGNVVKRVSDIERAIEIGKKIPQIKGILIVKGKHLGAWGDLKLKFT